MGLISAMEDYVIHIFFNLDIQMVFLQPSIQDTAQKPMGQWRAYSMIASL
nr:hypothetical protein [Pasteuria penetrans]